MAVVTSKEAIRSGYIQEDVLSGLKTYHRTWIVVTNSRLDGPQTVLDHADTPQLYETWSCGNDSDADAALVRRHPVRDPQNPLLWTIDLEYQLIPGYAQGEAGTSETTWMLPEIRFFFIEYTKPCEKDNRGNALTNSANKPYNPKAQIDDSLLAVQIVRNEVEYVPNTAIYYNNTVNTDVIFGGVKPRCAKLTTLAGQRKAINNQLWWEVTYEIRFKATTWDLELLNQGIEQINPNWSPSDDAATKWKRVELADGMFATEPVFLDDNGLPTLTPTFKRHCVYGERGFAALNLPPLVVELYDYD